MAYAVRVAATFAVSWRSPDRRTGGNTEDRGPRADAQDLRVSEPFRAGHGKLRAPAVDHFVRAPVIVATAVRARVSWGLRPGRELAPPPVVLQRFMEENVPFEHRQRSGDELNPREQVSLKALKRLAEMHDEELHGQHSKPRGAGDEEHKSTYTPSESKRRCTQALCFC